MFTYSIRLTYIEGYGDGSISEHYYITAPNSCLAIDNALTLFLEEYGLNFDDDVDNIKWSYCPV